MDNNSIGKYVAFAVFGFVLFAGGAALLKLQPDAQGVMLTLPYVFVGVGTGIFGGNLGTVIQIQLFKKDPAAAKQHEINAKDERNIAINTKAKAKAYDMMLMVYGALLIAFALMQVDKEVLLAIVAAYLFIVFSMVYYSDKYNKEM